MLRTLEFEESQRALILLDQTRLPRETVFVACRTAEDVAEAIKKMQVRGAPAIGVTAAYGMALAALAHPSNSVAEFQTALDEAASTLRQSRPTAINLQWAVDRMLGRGRAESDRTGVTAAQKALLQLAHSMAEEDVAANRRMGSFGLDLIPQGANVLTHCNT